MSELALRSYDRGIYEYSDFLSQAQQSELKKLRLPVSYDFFGGYDNAERCIAVFGNKDEFGYLPDMPVKYILIEPLQMKFADALTHRDFLGSVIGLGVKRETLGDIVIKDNRAYLVCLDTVADYVIENLDKVRHTSVKCSVWDNVPADVLPELTYEEYIVSSERLDVVISAVYNLSRNESQKKIDSELVFCNSVLMTSSSATLQNGTIVSVRGFGRFVYDGVLRPTKKGRNVIAVRKY